MAQRAIHCHWHLLNVTSTNLLPTWFVSAWRVIRNILHSPLLKIEFRIFSRTVFLVFTKMLHFKAVEVSFQKTLFCGHLCQNGSHFYVTIIKLSMLFSTNAWKAQANINGTTFIKPQHWEFDDLQFTTDASLHAGGVTCPKECFICPFPEDTAHHCLGTLYHCGHGQVLGYQASPAETYCFLRQRNHCDSGKL